jgi:diguanylate cyclase (GGDEF)-like protein
MVEGERGAQRDFGRVSEHVLPLVAQLRRKLRDPEADDVPADHLTTVYRICWSSRAGHAAGDKLIRQFAGRLRGAIRASDTAARLGGDEFAIIQTDIARLEDVEELCARIVGAAAEPFLIGGSQVHGAVSVGVALDGKDGLDAEELARRADIALYEAKAAGRGQYKLFTAVMDEPIRAHQNAEKDLRAALEADDQLSIAYQPTYSASNGAVVGVEALIRWQHPEIGNVPPSVFIPVAEEIGLIEALGDWVIAQACRDARHWPVGTLSINVSPVQLRNPQFAARAIAIIAEAGIAPARIEFEITETAVMEDVGQCAANLRTLREFGVRVALDDFVTGHSSLSHFNRFRGRPGQDRLHLRRPDRCRRERQRDHPGDRRARPLERLPHHRRGGRDRRATYVPRADRLQRAAGLPARPSGRGARDRCAARGRPAGCRTAAGGRLMDCAARRT